MVTGIRTGTDRRQHRRHDADIDASCRRIGGRPTPDRSMRVLDLSHGGARLLGSGNFLTGDVVLTTVQANGRDLTLKGLVVSSSVHTENDDGHFAHIAFTSMADADRDRLSMLLHELAERDAASN